MQKKILLCLLLVPGTMRPYIFDIIKNLELNYKAGLQKGVDKIGETAVSGLVLAIPTIICSVLYAKYGYNKDSNDKRMRITQENKNRISTIKYLLKQIDTAINNQSPKKLIRNIKYLDKEIARLENIHNRTDEEQQELTAKIATRKMLDQRFIESQSRIPSEQHQQNLRAKVELITKLDKALVESQYNNIKPNRATTDGLVYEQAKQVIAGDNL